MRLVSAETVERVETPVARRWLLAVTPGLRWLIIRYSVPVPQSWRTSSDTCDVSVHAGDARAAGRRAVT
jgi:hypothetical protein